MPGQTVTTPSTRAQASGEIVRLRHTPPASRLERRLEQRAVNARDQQPSAERPQPVPRAMGR